MEATSPFLERSLEQEDEKGKHELATPPSDDSKEGLSQDLKEQPIDEVPTEEVQKWVTGIPLLTIMGAICLVCFLMLLDTSIVVTVRATTLEKTLCYLTRSFRRPFPRSRANSTRFRMWVDTVVPTS